MSLNKVMLIGLVGKDPEIREAQGNKVASFTLATSERYKDKNGEYQTNTEWHNLVCWKQAEFVEKYITKGAQVYVEGKLRTRSWDDSNGIKRYVAEIIVNDIKPLDRKRDGQQGQHESAHSPAPAQKTQQKPQTTAMPYPTEVDDDDLPFN